MTQSNDPAQSIIPSCVSSPSKRSGWRKLEEALGVLEEL